MDNYLTLFKNKLFGFSFVFLVLATTYGQEVQKTTIFWDTSSSREDRNAALEIEYLNAYFQRFENADVSLVCFGNAVHFREDYTIRNGDWEVLQKKIESLEYDGATSFYGFETYASEGYNLIFTDGYQNAGKAIPKLQGKAVVINSSKSYDKRTINLFSIIGKADFLNLVKQKEDDSKNATAPAAPKGQSSDSTASDMKEGVQLEEVVVTEERENPVQLENTALGLKDKDALGYAVQSISSDKILDAATALSAGVSGKFSGVSIGQNDDLSRVVMRPSNSLLGNNYGLIVVDGIPLPQSQSSADGLFYPTSFLDPKNVEDITVLKGLAATNIYGTLGVNGVLLVTTKTGSYGKVGDDTSDAMQLKNNYYDSKIKIDNKTVVTPYLKELKKGKDVQSAYDIYLKQRNEYKGSPSYFIDVFDFFYASSPAVAFRILSNVLEVESPSYKMLRAAYLKSSQARNYELALAIVNRLMEEYPNTLQNNFDYAASNRSLGNYQTALNTLNVLLKDKINSVPELKGFEKSVGAEIRNLINQHRKELDITKVDIKYHNNITYNARLVLEWSNPEAEFVVQFVNPQKRFFDWEHTMQSDGRRLQEEIKQGSFTEQFEIVGAETVGDWILNITSHGNITIDDKTPTFIKCTVFKNFGKSNQETISYMVRLQEPNEKQQLAKFTVD
ncbi:TonB-dependent receptor plug domain-containing protein [Flagellimonas sp. S174]|uniref:TonB-dependent receptor plug domain-containing protein n=1 Tax=Flagellimonas sp. S174 TaxID=3410790 RepID=UPI003BF52DA6